MSDLHASITPRQAERAAIIAALEQDYSSDRVAADAILRVALDLLQERDGYVLKIPAGPTLRVAFGPFYHAGAVKAVARTIPDAEVSWLASPFNLLRSLDPDKYRKPTTCPNCVHPLFAHGFANRNGCVVPKCRCKERAA